MWSSWGESARKSLTDALEQTGDALEKTGDALTKAATKASRQHRPSSTTTVEEDSKGDNDGSTDEANNNDNNNKTKKSEREGTSETTTAAATATAAQEGQKSGQGQQQPASSSSPSKVFFPNLQAGLSSATAGITSATAGLTSATAGFSSSLRATTTTATTTAATASSPAGADGGVTTNSSGTAATAGGGGGWMSKTFLQDTLQKAQASVEKVESSIQKGLQQATEQVGAKLEQLQQHATVRERFYKRSVKLPLDVEALQDAQVVYVTDRLITCSHPAMASQQYDPDEAEYISASRKLAAFQHLLEKRHGATHYMVWNLSEVPYDYSVLDDQVFTYSFPGSPSPPLGLLLKCLVSMEAWLRADPANVAVVHCLTGKGRSSTVLAAFLCWMGEAGFNHDVHAALAYIAAAKHIKSEHGGGNASGSGSGSGGDGVDDLVIPSQRRYASYFSNMLDGVRPCQPPLMLRRMIMSQAPAYALGPALDKDKNKEGGNNSTAKGGGAGSSKDSPKKEGGGGGGDAEHANADGGAATTSNSGSNSNNDQKQETSEEANNKNADKIETSKAEATTKTTTGSSKSNKKKLSLQDYPKEQWGCAPYIQVFSAGKLLHTAAASLHFQQPPDTLPFCQVAHGSIRFDLNVPLQGDVLIRCRHLTQKRARVSMFRAAFHTGYVPPTVLRLTKSQLDGACHDDKNRFPKDFFLDLIFEPCTAEEASAYLQKKQREQEKEEEEAAKQKEKQLQDQKDGQQEQALHEQEHTIKATAYDTMLHGDSRFWDVINKRRQEQEERENKKKLEQQQQQQEGGGGAAEGAADQQASQDEDNKKKKEAEDPMWGPTVGRRRQFAAEGKQPADQHQQQQQGTAGKGGGATTAKAPSQELETFSIGGEFDFLPSSEPKKPKKNNKATAASPKRDSLMEALMALDEHDDHDHHDEDDNQMQEIVFGDAGSEHSDDGPMFPNHSDSTADEPKSSINTKTGGKDAASTMDALLANDGAAAGEDMDALLAATAGTTNDAAAAPGNANANANADDTMDLDDDPELEDLENFLAAK